MPNPKPLLVAIVGPTASGKSGLAVRLARTFNGEVISADSRQVYRDLDLGTGKVTRRDMRGVPHHLLDVADPRRQFSVAEFQRRAERAMHAIANRGHLPIIVGGSTFWIDALVHGLAIPAVPPNRTLRNRLAKKRPDELLAILTRLDPRRAKTVEPKNPRRLIRAIEIARAIGQTPKVKWRTPYRTLWIGLNPPPAVLKKRIRRRLNERIRRGMVAEAKRLRRAGLPWKRFYELGLEYRFLADHLRNNLTREEMIDGLERAIQRYARRQLAWLRKNTSIRWLRRTADANRLLKAFIAGETARVRRATTE